MPQHRGLALFLATAALLIVAACQAGGPVADLDGLAPGWNTIEPAGDTTCSDGSPYRFFVRPGNPAKLVVYFDGGGACFDGRTCDPHLDPTYTVNLSQLDLERADGIFAFESPENPFADHSFVFAPYCTADVHLGDRVENYQAPDGEQHPAHAVTIQHRGSTNAGAVLDWTYKHFFRPASLFVTGSSGGAIPSPYYALRIADHYPDAGIGQLGDGAGGYRGLGDTRPHEHWGTLDVLSDLSAFTEMTSEEFTFEELYIAAAQQHPRITFAEYDTAEDGVQLQFLELGGVEASSLLRLLEANQAEVRAEATNFRSFIAGGDLHTILARPRARARLGGVVGSRRVCPGCALWRVHGRRGTGALGRARLHTLIVRQFSARWSAVRHARA